MSAYSSAVLGIPNLQAYWRLGETTGAFVDSVGGDDNGAVRGVPVRGVAGGVPGDTDLALDGNAVGGFAATLASWPSQWSIGGLVYIHAYDQTARMLAQAQGAKFTIQTTTADLVTLSVGGSGIAGVAGQPATFPVGQWAHWVATFDSAGGQATLYLNGQAMRQSNGGVFAAPASFIVGFGSTSNGGQYANAVLDEHFLVARKMTAAEVLDLYNAWLPPAPPAASTAIPPSAAAPGQAYFGGLWLGGRTYEMALQSATDQSLSSDSAHYTPPASVPGAASDSSPSSDAATRRIVRLTRPPLNGGLYYGGAYFGAYGVGVPPGGEFSASADTPHLTTATTHQALTEVSLSSDVARRVFRQFAGDVSLSHDTASGGLIIPLGAMAPVSLRERAPLRLSVTIETPDGQFARWAADDPNPGNAPSGLTLTSAMPGGFENFSCSLQRDPSYEYRDLEELSRVTVHGAGGEVAWEGRLESLPDQGGDAEAINPAGVGYQSHLDDNASARALIVNRSISQWIGPGISRQIHQVHDLATNSNGPSIGPDTAPAAQPLPSLITEIDGAWTEQHQAAEAWFNARGLPIERFYAAWETNFAAGLSMDSSGANFINQMGLGDNDSDDPSWITGGLGGSPGSYTMFDPIPSHSFAMARLYNGNTAGGIDGGNAQLFWTVLALYGATGIPLQGTFTQTDAPGVLASDAIKYLVEKFAPLLGVTSESIQSSSFVIPQLAWLDPTKLSDMVKEAAKYELLDWAVWEGPTFWLNPRGGRGRKWRARVGPASLQDAGPQISRLWNGVVVTYADVSGITMTVGPPGSGADHEDPSLEDSDPENPINQLKLSTGESLKRWTVVQMGSSTQGAAIQIGSIFLQEQKKLSQAGQATLTGHVQDDNGVFWPAWMVRAGDYISFVDAHDPSYRRIVHTSYNDDSKECAVQLDQPPDSLQAILERLNIVLAPYGM